MPRFRLVITRNVPEGQEEAATAAGKTLMAANTTVLGGKATEYAFYISEDKSSIVIVEEYDDDGTMLKTWTDSESFKELIPKLAAAVDMASMKSYILGDPGVAKEAVSALGTFMTAI